MNAGKKITNTYKFSEVNKFIWNWFQLIKTFLIDIKKYFLRFKGDSIIAQNISRIFFIKDQLVAKLLKMSYSTETEF